MVSTNKRKDIYTCNGTGPYAITFPVEFDVSGNAKNIKAQIDENSPLATDKYTVTGLNVTTVDTYDGTHQITIYRETPATQTLDYQSGGGAFDLDTLEKQGLDRAILMIQERLEEIERTLKAPVSDPAGVLEIPGKTTRASTHLAFDADGKPIASGGIPSVPATAWAATLLDDADAAAGRGTLDVYSKSEVSGLSGVTVTTEDALSVRDIVVHKNFNDASPKYGKLTNHTMLGAKTEIDTASHVVYTVVALANGVFFAVLRDDSPTTDALGQAIRVNDNGTLSYGTPAKLDECVNSSPGQYCRAAKIPGQDYQCVVALPSASDSQLVVVEVDPSDLTFSSVSSAYDASNTSHSPDICFTGAGTLGVLVYGDSAGAGQAYPFTVNTSTLAVTFRSGGAYQFCSAIQNYRACMCKYMGKDPEGNHLVVIGYKYTATNYYVTFVVLRVTDVDTIAGSIQAADLSYQLGGSSEEFYALIVDSKRVAAVSMNNTKDLAYRQWWVGRRDADRYWSTFGAVPGGTLTGETPLLYQNQSSWDNWIDLMIHVADQPPGLLVITEAKGALPRCCIFFNTRTDKGTFLEPLHLLDNLSDINGANWFAATAFMPDGSRGLHLASNTNVRPEARTIDVRPRVLGFSTQSVAVSASVSVQTSGQLGGFSGLVPGATYYVDHFGNLTTRSDFEYTKVGKAITPTVLDIAIEKTW